MIEHLFRLDQKQDEFGIWAGAVKPALRLPPNIIGICKYGFTEIFNNVVDHSQGSSVKVRGEQGDRCDVRVIPQRKGTLIRMEIANDSSKTTKQVFDQFCGGEEYAFYKTRFLLSLAAIEGNLISRAQAKRVATRSEKFSEVALDFSGVENIGQAFADELLRVWPLAHPQTKLVVANANEAVQKMVGHIQSRKDLPHAPRNGSKKPF